MDFPPKCQFLKVKGDKINKTKSDIYKSPHVPFLLHVGAAFFVLLGVDFKQFQHHNVSIKVLNPQIKFMKKNINIKS